ncbi:MAG: hypothetical protein ABL999_00960 [Pyrinomonadaceae bacterium]
MQKGQSFGEDRKGEGAQFRHLPELSARVLELLQERKRLSELVGSTDANQNTLKVRLRELVESGRIERHGKARATWYAMRTAGESANYVG